MLDFTPEGIDVNVYDVKARLAFMLDVDNTLINNDQVKIDVTSQMETLLGHEQAERFWAIYEQVRKETDVVDIPLSLKRIEPEMTNKDLYRKLYRLWNDFPYRNYIYPGVFEALAYLNTIGRPIILSDGDPSFQLKKIVTSGLARAVNGDVLIYVHKQEHLEDIENALPAYHYVMVEDKPTLLTHMKDYFEDRITTVLVKQGKYANDPKQVAQAKPDLIIPGIADLKKFTPAQYASDRF